MSNFIMYRVRGKGSRKTRQMLRVGSFDDLYAAHAWEERRVHLAPMSERLAEAFASGGNVEGWFIGWDGTAYAPDEEA